MQRFEFTWFVPVPMPGPGSTVVHTVDGVIALMGAIVLGPPLGPVGRVIEAIADAGRTGKIGDGKVWSVDVGELLRIRTGEMGEDAV